MLYFVWLHMVYAKLTYWYQPLVLPLPLFHALHSFHLYADLAADRRFVVDAAVLERRSTGRRRAWRPIRPAPAIIDPYSLLVSSFSQDSDRLRPLSVVLIFHSYAPLFVGSLVCESLQA